MASRHIGAVLIVLVVRIGILELYSSLSFHTRRIWRDLREREYLIPNIFENNDFTDKIVQF